MRGSVPLAVIGALALASSGMVAAEESTHAKRDLGDIIQRLEQQDKEAREDGFVLEHFPVEQPLNDPRRKSMKLSIGQVGGGPDERPFDDDRSNYVLDPATPVDTPPIGFSLKLKF